ncbi:pentapeptide repeat-containing protein [Listeria monocytogenes]|nr:pentapeptide repeat-containing protein [Listeria monocytogenes]
MKQEELNIVLENHGKWLRGESGVRANLSYANLTNANLTNANLRDADLRGADFSGADLRYANLRDADLRDADLRGADFSGADLRYANLRDADLRDVDFSGANLSWAKLSWAKLSWANWQEVKGLTVIAVQVGTSRRNNQIAYIKELDIWTTGCFQGTLDELKASIEKTHGDNEKLRKRYYRVIDFILTEVAE